MSPTQKDGSDSHYWGNDIGAILAGIGLRCSAYYDRDIANEMFKQRGKVNMAEHPVLLLRGVDRCGKNAFSHPAS